MSAPAPRAMAEFAASHHGVVVRSQAVSFGFTPHDIRMAKQRGWLTEPVRGVLVVAGYPPTWEQRLAIVIAASAARQVHQTALLDAADRYQADGLPCTGLARTLADLGSTESAEKVWQALISARRIHRVNPMWLQQTALRVHRPGQAGSGVLLASLRRWSDEGTLPDSWFEELLRRLLDHPDIPQLQRQYVLSNNRGVFVARLDLLRSA